MDISYQRNKKKSTNFDSEIIFVLIRIKTNDLVRRRLRTFCHGNLFFLSNIIMPSSFIYSSTNFLLALTHVHSLCAMLFFPNPGKIEIRSDR